MIYFQHVSTNCDAIVEHFSWLLTWLIVEPESVMNRYPNNKWWYLHLLAGKFTWIHMFNIFQLSNPYAYFQTTTFHLTLTSQMSLNSQIFNFAKNYPTHFIFSKNPTHFNREIPVTFSAVCGGDHGASVDSWTSSSTISSTSKTSGRSSSDSSRCLGRGSGLVFPYLEAFILTQHGYCLCWCWVVILWWYIMWLSNHTYIYIYVYIYIHMYVCIYIHMYIYI